jgi:MFS family permease
MSFAAFRAQSASDAALSHLVFKVVHTAIAVGIVGAVVFAPPNEATLALDQFDGSRILQGHGIATQLGAETFAAVGSPNGAVGWLGALVADALAPAGAVLGTFLATLVALFTFALVERRARRAGGPLFGVLATGLAVLCALGSMGFAGGLVTAAFAVTLAEILDRPGKRAAILATLLAVAWCNVAAQGLFAPALALLFALGARLEARGQDVQRWRWMAFGGTALALLATPAFFSYPGIAFEELRLDRMLQDIVQFNPIDVAPPAYRVGFLLAMFAAFAIGLPRRIGDVLLFLAAGLLALANGTYLPVFGVLIAPLLAASAAAAPPLPTSRPATARGDVLVAIASVLAAAVLVTTLVARERPAVPAYALAATLARDGKPHRLMCLYVDWCDAALVSGSTTRVFMDGRVGAYPQRVRDAQLELVRLAAHWRRTLDADRIDALLTRKDRPLSMLISLSPGWRAVASDDVAVLYERKFVVR